MSIDRLPRTMLPAIYFIFSRKGCDEAVKQCLRDNVRLTTPDERKAISHVREERVARSLPIELEVLRLRRLGRRASAGASRPTTRG